MLHLLYNQFRYEQARKGFRTKARDGDFIEFKIIFVEFFKNFDQNSNQKLPINFSEEDIFRIPQKITNSDDYFSRISISSISWKCSSSWLHYLSILIRILEILWKIWRILIRILVKYLKYLFWWEYSKLSCKKFEGFQSEFWKSYGKLEEFRSEYWWNIWKISINILVVN